MSVRLLGTSVILGAVSLIAFTGHPLTAQNRAPDKGCNITYSANDALTALVRKEKFATDYFEQLCPWLSANGLELTMSSDAGELAERSYAWVNARVMRTRHRITGTRSAQTTVIREETGGDASAGALRQALDSALIDLTADREQHLRELVQVEAEAARAQ